MWNAHCPCPPGEVYTAAHNEYLQWAYETGVAGCLLVLGWFRVAWRTLHQAEAMWQGAVAAVAVLALGLQVFHLPTVAPIMLGVLGGGLHVFDPSIPGGGA